MEVNLFLNYENRTLFKKDIRVDLPITIITGYLGSGKTTLLKNILKLRQNLKISTIINDFADYNVDSEIISNSLKDDNFLSVKKPNNEKYFTLIGDKANTDITKPTGAVNVHSFSSGCLCCSKPLVSQFESTVYDHLQTSVDDIQAADALIIETSGLTNPSSIIASLDKKFGKLTRARLDSVITVVDADVTADSIKNKREIVGLNQILVADVVLINKIDLVTEGDILLIQNAIQKISPGVITHTCALCNVPLPYILDVAFATSDGYGSSGGVNHESSLASSAPLVVTNNSRHKAINSKIEIDDHLVKNQFDSITLSSGSIYFSNFHKFISNLPNSVLRVKGFVNFFHDSSKWLFHLAGRKRYDFTREAWQSLDVKMCHIIVIGTTLDSKNIKELWNTLNHEPVISPLAFETWNKLLLPNLQLDIFEHKFACKKLDPSLFILRATGARYYQFKFADLKLRGIDLNGLNKQLVAAINKCGSNNLVLYDTDLIGSHKGEYFEPDSIWILVSMDVDDGDILKLTERFNTIVYESEKILDFVFKHVHHCRCPI